MTEETNEKKHSYKKILFFLLFLILLLGIYLYFIEPHLLVVKEYAIIDNQIPYSFHGIKIVEFSDLFYGKSTDDKMVEKVVQKINELNPDIVLFTGDLISSEIHINEENEENLKKNLKDIHANLKKYAVLGDQDYTDKMRCINILENAEFTLLNNKNDALYFEDSEPILFIGTTSLLENEANFQEALASTEDLSSYYKIWLSHEPILWEELESSPFKPNLIFSGHTLGGLISFPFGISLLHQPGDAYKNDFYENENTKMYVSHGIGTYKYPVRFLNPPSISLYRLYQY